MSKQSRTPAWAIPYNKVDRSKLCVREKEITDGVKIYEVCYGDDDMEPQTYFMMPAAQTVYTQIDPTRALQSKFKPTKESAKLTVKVKVTNPDMEEFINYCNEELLEYARENDLIGENDVKIWNMKDVGMEKHFTCSRRAYVRNDGGYRPVPINVWKNVNGTCTYTPMSTLMRASVYTSVNFVLLVGNFTGIRSSLLCDVMVKRIEKPKSFDPIAMGFVDEFEDEQSKRKVKASSSTSSTQRARKRTKTNRNQKP